MDTNSKTAIELFRRAQRLKEQGKLNKGFGIGPASTMPRVRLRSHVDLTKADASCERCSGSGVSGYEQAGEERIQVICVCVSRGGGVKPDKLDAVLRGETRQQRRYREQCEAKARRKRD